MKRFIALALLIAILSCFVISCESNELEYIPTGTSTSTDQSSETEIAPGHTYTDDGNCTTALYCDECGELLREAKSKHNYSNIVDYSFVNDGINEGGIKTVACSNTSCTITTTNTFDKFIKALGYSVAEFESTNTATLTASYIFNSQNLTDYSNYLSKVNGKRVKFEYGILVYVEGQITGAPLTKSGSEAYGVVKVDLTGANGLNDFSVPKISKNAYDDGIFICSYMIIGNELYYIQSDNIYSEKEYKSLMPVTVNMVLGIE